MENEPLHMLNQSLEVIQAYKRKILIKDFCRAAESVGFTQDQIIKMVKTIPKNENG